MKKRKQAKVAEAQPLENGDVRLTFTRPVAVRPGMIFNVEGLGPHDIISVQSAHVFTVRPWPKPERKKEPVLARAKKALSVLRGAAGVRDGRTN